MPFGEPMGEPVYHKAAATFTCYGQNHPVDVRHEQRPVDMVCLTGTDKAIGWVCRTCGTVWTRDKDGAPILTPQVKDPSVSPDKVSINMNSAAIRNILKYRQKKVQ